MDKIIRYVKWMLFSSLFLFTFVSLTNFLVDPNGQFGFTEKYEVPNLEQGFNINKFIYKRMNIWSRIQLHKNDLLMSNKASVAMIGSSRTSRGYNACESLHLKKVPLIGISRGSTHYLSREVVKALQYSTLLVELGGLIRSDLYYLDDTNIVLPEAPEASMHDLLSFHTLILSIAKIMHHLDNQSNNINFCADLGKNVDFEVNEGTRDTLKKNSEKVFFGPRFTQRLATSLTQLTEYCEKSPRTANTPLDIIIILGPIHPNILSDDQAMLLQKRSELIIADYGNEICQFSFRIAASNSRTRDNNNWYKYSHFKPILGNAFLKDLKIID